MRLRYIAVAAVIIIIILISSVVYVHVTAKPSTRILDSRIETKEKEWKECEKYLVKLEIDLSRIDIEKPLLETIGVKVFLNWTLIYDVKILNVTVQPLFELSKIEVVLVVHPQRGIVSAGVCLKFDLTILVEFEIEHPVLLGSKRTSMSVKTPPVSIILCSGL